MLYKESSIRKIKTSSTAFDDAETLFDKFNETDTTLEHSKPLDVDFYLFNINECIDNNDYDTLLEIIDDLTEKLKDKQYFLSDNYSPGSISSVILNLFDSEHSHLLVSFILAWTSFQDVENDDFANPDFFAFLMNSIEYNDGLDPNYDKIDNYHSIFYNILKNLLIDSKKMRDIFISENPIPLFTKIYYNSEKYYPVSYNGAIINKKIIEIINSALQDHFYSNILPPEFLDSFSEFFDLFVFRTSNFFQDTKEYEFEFLQTFLQVSEDNLMKFFSHFQIQQYFASFNILTNERIFPFLRILRSIFQNIQNFSDDANNYIKYEIIQKIQIDKMIEYFYNHDKPEESLQYVKFLNQLFIVSHDFISLFFDYHINEIERFQNFISDGYYKLRIATLPLFHIIFKIKTPLRIEAVFTKLNEDFLAPILDLINEDDDHLTIQILKILKKILKRSFDEDSIIDKVYTKFEDAEVYDIVDEMIYQDDQSKEIIDLCNKIKEILKATKEKVDNNIFIQKTNEEYEELNPLTPDTLIDDFNPFDNSDYDDMHFWP